MRDDSDDGDEVPPPTPTRSNWLALVATATVSLAAGLGGGFVAGGQYGKRFNARELAEAKQTAEAATRDIDGVRAERDRLAGQVNAFAAREAEEQQARRAAAAPAGKAPEKAPAKKKEWTFDEAVRSALALAADAGREEQAAMGKRLTPGEADRVKSILESKRVYNVTAVLGPGAKNPVDELTDLGLRRTAAGYLVDLVLNDRRCLRVLKYGWEKVEALRSDEALFKAAIRVGGCSTESLASAIDMIARDGEYRPGDPAAAAARPALEHIFGVTADKLR